MNISLRIRIAAAVAAGVCVSQIASAATYYWNWTNGVSADSNWSSSVNWAPQGTPGTNDAAFFVGTNIQNVAPGAGLSTAGGGPTAVNLANFNSAVDAGFGGTVTNLVFSNTAGSYQNVWLPGNTTLTIAGTPGLVVGNGSGTSPGSGGVDYGDTAVNVALAGPGATLAVTNTNALVWVSEGSSPSSGSLATLDMSALGYFNATISRMLIGVPAVNRPAGTVYLAATNTITAEYQTGSTETSDTVGVGAIDIGDPTTNPGGVTSYLYLGQSNYFSADTICVGRQKGTGEIEFNPNLTGNPVAVFGGFTNSRVTTWSAGDGVANSGTATCTGTADFSAGIVTAMVNTMYVGRAGANASGSGTATGTVTFGAGTFNVNNLYAGLQPTANTAGKNGVGTINVNNNATLGTSATLIVNTNLNLAFCLTANEAAGTLNITGGTALINNIVAGTNNNGTASTITMTGGTLIVSNLIGSGSAPLSVLSLSSATVEMAAGNSTANAMVGTLNINDSGTVINVSLLPLVASFPTQFPLITYSSLGAGGTLNLGPLPNGFKGYISNDNVSTVWVVVTNGSVKTDQWGGNVNNIWNTTSLNWTNNGVSVAYNENDLVLFDDYSKVNNINVPAIHSPTGWSVNNSTNNYTFGGIGSIGGTAELVKDGTASLTLTETGGDNFTGGIILNGGTLVLDDANGAISGGLAIASGATAQIGNGDTNGALPSGAVQVNGTLVFDQTANVVVSTAISGGGSLTQNGSGTLTLSGPNSYTGNTTVNNGTLAVTGAGTISSSAAVGVTNATLDVSGVTGTNALSLGNVSLAGATVNVSVPYNLPAITATNLSASGSANTINVVSLPPIASYPSTVTLIQSGGPITGFNIRGTLPAGYSGSVVESADTTAVLLTLTNGPVGVRPEVLWSGADVSNLNTNWSDGANWQLPGAPVSGDTVIFNNTGSQSSSALSSLGGGPSALQPAYIDNIVNGNFTLSSLTYTNVSGSYHNTYIASNAVLAITNTGGLTVGSGTVDFGGGATEYVTISGSNGTLTVTNTNATILVTLESAAGADGQQATLDMSALGTFNANVSSFAVGAIASTAPYANGTAYLAQTNVITAVGGTVNESGQDETLSFMVGETGKTATGTCYLYLGWTNVINANSIGVSLAKEPAEMEFNSALTTNPWAVFRAADGVSPVPSWTIGDGLAQTGASTTPNGTVDFTGGTVDALVATMYLGRIPNVSGGHAATGTLTFGAGTINVGTLIAGYQAYSQSDYGVGTVNVNGPGTLIVSNLTLGFTTGGTGTASTTGTLNISGAVWAGAIVAGANGSTSTINLNGGVLIVTNTAGTPAVPLTALNLMGGTLELDGASTDATNVVATAITTSGTTILQVGSLSGVAVNTEYPLISYAPGSQDPYSSLTLSLPTGYDGSLVDDTTNSLIGLTLTHLAPPPPQAATFRGATVSAGNLVLSGNGGVPTGTFYVLTSTNLSLPLTNWTVISTNSYDSSGNFSVTNAYSASGGQRFYMIGSP